MIEQRSEEWYKQRLGKITASKADDVMAEAKTKGAESAGWRNYRAALVTERLTNQPAEDDPFVSNAMQRGIDLEPKARAWYVNKTGNLVTQLGFTAHKEHPYAGCSVDSEVDDDGGLEIKCPNTANHIDVLLNGGTKYKNQINFQMWVMGWKWVDFVTFDDRLPEHLWGSLQRMPRDEELIKRIEFKVIQLNHETNTLVERLKALKP
jgi:putative phage-type endonuclease